MLEAGKVTHKSRLIVATFGKLPQIGGNVPSATIAEKKRRKPRSESLRKTRVGCTEATNRQESSSGEHDPTHLAGARDRLRDLKQE